MAASYRSHATTDSGGGTSIALTKPSGVASGDVLVAWLLTGNESLTTYTGWTLLGESSWFGGKKVSFLKKVAGGSEPASYTFEIANFDQMRGVIIAYQDAGDVDVSAVGSTDFTGTLTPTQITPTGDGRLILMLLAGEISETTATPDTSPAATERVEWSPAIERFFYAQDYLQVTAASVQLEAGFSGYQIASFAQVAITAGGGGGGGAPGNSVPPAVTGTPTQGQTLTTDTGSWTGSPSSYAYQWQRDNSGGGSYSDIGAATSTTYVLTGTDVGCNVRCRVTATNGSGSTPANSNASLVGALFTCTTAGRIEICGNALMYYDADDPVYLVFTAGPIHIRGGGTTQYSVLVDPPQHVAPVRTYGKRSLRAYSRRRVWF